MTLIRKSIKTHINTLIEVLSIHSGPALKSLVLAAFLGGLIGCGYPAHQLTPEQKASDIDWIFAIIDNNYAPSEVKKEWHGVDIKSLKESCTNKAKETTTNEEFNSVVIECVKQLQDGHTTAIQSGQLLPETAKMAYLGIVTSRSHYTFTEEVTKPDGGKESIEQKTDAIYVEGLLPSFSDPFPLKAKDLIIAINDQSVSDYLNKEIVPSINVGQPESNLSIAAIYFPNRSTLQFRLPKDLNIHLTVVRGSKKLQLDVPWNIKDIAEFNIEQAKAAKEKDPEKEKSKEQEPNKDKEKKTDTQWDSGYAHLFVSFKSVEEIFSLLNQTYKNISQRAQILLENSFVVRFLDPYTEELLSNPNYKITNDSKSNQELDAPSPSAFMINSDESKSDSSVEVPTEKSVDTEVIITEGNFPAKVIFKNKDAKLGYIKIRSFMLTDADLVSFSKILQKMNNIGVKGIVLDLLDNGGGSLVHGSRMAQMLSTKRLKFPKMKVRLNDNWINSFKSQAAFGRNASDRTVATRIYDFLKEDRDKGLKLSREMPIENLDVFQFNSDLNTCTNEGTCLKPNIKLALVVNEFCASMCDIFAGIFRDNKLGKIVGMQTMGAGGNVTNHGFSPISKFILSQTESLIVDSNGQYLENHGVKPDYDFDTVLDRRSKFVKTLNKSYQVLIDEK